MKKSMFIILNLMIIGCAPKGPQLNPQNTINALEQIAKAHNVLVEQHIALEERVEKLEGKKK